MEDLTQRDTHFEFGENWNAFSGLIDERRIDMAKESTSNLAGDLKDKSFLDIGSGSGLFSLSALRLGATRVLSVDIDENSVATTRSTLASHASGGWEARQISVFDLPDVVSERFDVVYSWGVLHQTGDMWRAIERAAEMVKPNGVFVFSLYEKTPLCGAWRVEKRIYSRAPRLIQTLMRWFYIGVHMLGRAVTFRNPFTHVAGGVRERGMDFHRDLHDWMGGYPHETTTLSEVDPRMERLGFRRVQHNGVPVRMAGLMGTGCSEYVYRRV